MRVQLRSIQSRLFVWYSALIVALLLVFLGAFISYTSRLLIERASRSSVQLSATIAGGIDSEISAMNRVSVDVAFSREVGESFARLRAATSPSNRYNVRLALNQLLFGVIGPMLPVYQVNLFDLAGEGVGAGFAGVTPRLPAQGSDWRREALAREGARFITAPFPDPDDPTAGPLISLCRLYFDRSNARVGYIEVQQRADAVFASAREAVPVPDGFRAATRVVVLDGQGALLYPLAGSADEAVRVWADRLRSASQDRGTLSLRDPSTGARYLVARAGSELTGWTVAVIDSEQVLLSPVSSFTRGVAVAGVGAVLLVLFISYLLARRFGAPIAALSASVRSLTLSGAAVRAREPSSGIEELDALSASFAQMRARLGESVEQLVRSRSLELRARMLALQSQMNPHFLYNTISTIGALAEDGRSTEIAGMCDELSRMLRYVSAAEPAEVTLAEEIEHTRHFLGLMRHRYEEQVSWSIDIPRDLLEIPVPRLSVQPLVENSLKHGIHVPPPWKVTVSAERRDGRWFVSVADNGAGFTSETLSTLRRHMSELERSPDIPETTAAGLGIMSIYLRLRLLHGDEAFLGLENGARGGALVRFGAPIAEG